MIKIIGDITKVEEFLEGQVTSDSNIIKDESYQLSSICNQKGLVMADFFITKEKNEFKIIIEESLVEVFIDDLSPYAKFFGVTFELSAQFVIGSIVKNEELKTFLKSEYFSLEIQISNKKNNLNEPIKHDEWLVANKIVRNYFLSIDDVNKYRPLELNYDQLRVSFEKGCYRGQEVVARMKYLGIDRRRFSTVITKNNYDFKKEFKVIGSKINLNNYFIFNSIIKRESLERLNATDGVVTII